ncbi:LmbE family N-acetylglucosaminyl deacetylase [Williamsia limnetica]|uniref:LmbE family N-acetylglucosaminyl deacetylase n=1 Tax=Williamsia limnetica TaxID=882452 RepID=A0A318RJG3_WILLI|nr:PIG-L family deacetylase [Williamsia limnetica]PYE15419.1 LmbE family N-acetylglucosaminyl deacetylase [Williamsia limnetica]
MTSTERFEASPVADRGTDETQWQQWFSVCGDLPRLEIDVERLVVLAAHPDDEILGAAGVMIAAAAAGVDVVTVCLSDGSGSHPGSPTHSPHDLAAIRRAELDAATDILGLERSVWGGLPDGALSTADAAMTRIVEAVLDERTDTVTGVLSVWEDDGHPDHEAVGRCASRITAERGMMLWQYPIWMWHWAIPGEETIAWDALRAHGLDDAALATKKAAVQAFSSQIHPLSEADADQVVLPPHVLERLLRRDEYVFVR